jgi:membrane carboxypeptidase/penicillin-binding protein
MKILLRFFGFLFAAGTILFLAGITAVAGLMWHFSKDLPDYTQLQNYEPPVMARFASFLPNYPMSLGPTCRSRRSRSW